VLIEFLRPLYIDPAGTETYTYLQMAVRFAGQTGTSNPTYSPELGILLEGGMYGAPQPTVPVGQPAIKKFMLTIHTADGEILQTPPQVVDVTKPAPQKGWVWISMPFAAFKSGRPDGKIPASVKMRRLIITADTYDVFYVGQIGTVVDNDPLVPDAGDEQEVAVYDLVVFTGSCESGVSPVKYSWDFDDRDGIQEDAVGPVVYHRYTKRGQYNVTLTCPDPMAFKKPATAKTRVPVNE